MSRARTPRLLTPLRISVALHLLLLALLLHLAPEAGERVRAEPMTFRFVADETTPLDAPDRPADVPADEPEDTLRLPDFDVLLPALPVEETWVPPESPAATLEPPLAQLPIPDLATLRSRPAPVARPPTVVLPAPRVRAAPRVVPRVVRRPGTLRGFYPRDMQVRGIEGTVMVLVRVDARGQVVDARVRASSGHASLDRAALRVARLYEFAPGASGRALLPVPFRLRD